MRLFGSLVDPSQRPRVGLIHAQLSVIEPIEGAFAAWPEAQILNLVDDSLGVDLQISGRIDETLLERCRALARYAHLAGANLIMFTTAAFGAGVEASRGAVPIPVLGPSDAVIDEALDLGPRIGLLTTFELAHDSLGQEIEARAARQGRSIELVSRCVPEALRALIDRSSPAGHDRLVAATVTGMPQVDVLVLGQISLARAVPAIAPLVACTVLTSLDSAVRRARDLIEGTCLRRAAASA